MPRILIFNATPEAAEQRLVEAGARDNASLLASSLDQHIPSGRTADYVVLRVADGERLPQGLTLGDFDGIWISGSPFNVYRLDQASVREQIELTRAIWDAGVPAFGSCWGLQLMTAALGGSVRLNPRGREIGVARHIHLAPGARTHEMYLGKAPAFDAVCVHEDEVETLPSQGLLLASNAMSRVQAADFTDGARCFWGVQYHPEFDLGTVAAIISMRVEHHLSEGLARSAEDVAGIVEDYRALGHNPPRPDLIWKHGLGPDVLDPVARTLEFRNWLDAKVLPRAAARAT